MTALADMRNQLARETCELMRNVVRIALRATDSAIAASRCLTEPEQRALVDGFCASAVIRDITKHELHRERLGLSAFFPHGMVDNLFDLARVLADRTGMLEEMQDKFVIAFQQRLLQRIEKRLSHVKREGEPHADTDEPGTSSFQFTGNPSPDQGYQALTKLGGRYEKLEQAAREEVTRGERQKPVEPVAETPVAETLDEPVEDQPDEPVAETPAEPVANQPAEKPLDALWSDSELAPDMMELWKAANEWAQADNPGPPPVPTVRLLDALERNPRANPETVKLLGWLHTRPPPDS